MLAITLDTDDEKVSRLREDSAAENIMPGLEPPYHPCSAAVVSMSGKMRAHFSTQPKMMANGRYSAKMFACSANLAL